MKIIVTGGAGFIGSNLVKRLNLSGCNDIIIVDNLKNADKCLNLNRANFTDLVDRNDFLARIDGFTGFDMVIHLGACSSTSEMDGNYLLANNIDYSKRVLAWAQTNAVRMIYASSASVYGPGEKGFSDSNPEVERPINGYAFSKWVFDCHVRRLASERRLAYQVVGLRYFNVYGPQEWHKGGMCSPILHFHRQMSAEARLKLFEGSAGFKRDFVTVEDCCSVKEFFIAHPEQSGIFNCGTGSARSFEDIAGLMIGSYPGATIEATAFPAHLKSKYQQFTCADIAKLRSAGYDKAFTSIDVGVPALVRKLRSPQGGYLSA